MNLKKIIDCSMNYNLKKFQTNVSFSQINHSFTDDKIFLQDFTSKSLSYLSI